MPPADSHLGSAAGIPSPQIWGYRGSDTALHLPTTLLYCEVSATDWTRLELDRRLIREGKNGMCKRESQRRMLSILYLSHSDQSDYSIGGI